jgi:hypothetical protein
VSRLNLPPLGPPAREGQDYECGVRNGKILRDRELAKALREWADEGQAAPEDEAVARFFAKQIDPDLDLSTHIDSGYVKLYDPDKKEESC